MSPDPQSDGADQRWAAQAPAEYAVWVSMFPQSPAREAGVKIIAERWLPSDAPAAFAWLDSMKDEGLRQEVARAMEGVILQQPADIRAAWLQHADTKLQAELKQQRDAALKEDPLANTFLDAASSLPSPSPHLQALVELGTTLFQTH